MAAGLMCKVAGDSVDLDSAGTGPGATVNALSAESMQEVGVDITGETPKAITEDMVRVRRADLVVTLGREVAVDEIRGTRFENWDTEEPSERGIEGIERMRRVRDDIAARVELLTRQLQRS